MGNNKKKLSPKYQPWVDARKKLKLSHAHVQMARELGMNPKKLGDKANHKQEPWKSPLPVFIEELYLKRFGKRRPDRVRSIEQMVAEKKEKDAERKRRKRGESGKAPTNGGDAGPNEEGSRGDGASDVPHKGEADVEPRGEEDAVDSGAEEPESGGGGRSRRHEARAPDDEIPF